MTRPSIPQTSIGPDGPDPHWDDIRWFSEGEQRYALHYDRNNEPISLRDWVRGVESDEYRYVKITTVGQASIVTAWHGIDIDCEPDQPPKIFGTIEIRGVGEDPTYHDEESDHTEADALATHERRVEELRKGLT